MRPSIDMQEMISEIIGILSGSWLRRTEISERPVSPKKSISSTGANVRAATLFAATPNRAMASPFPFFSISVFAYRDPIRWFLPRA